GSMVYKVPGISATLGEVIEQTLEVTSRMVPTMRAHDLSLSVEEDESLESLSTLGWQPRSDNLAALTQSLWQKFENSNLSGQQTPESAEEEGIEEAQSNPISLSDLLAGRFTPFIKPHNS